MKVMGSPAGFTSKLPLWVGVEIQAIIDTEDCY